jgi:protein-tyrosine phosphatase
MEKLREEGVEAVLAIQSAEDHSSHQISPHYLQLLCTEFSITYRTHSILDANAVDFIEKCLGAVRSLIKLIKQERKKVYIHCSAGIFRSPQIVTLYLVIEKRMGLDEAMCLVRQKHRYAQPSAKVLNTVVRKLVGRAY